MNNYQAHQQKITQMKLLTTKSFPKSFRVFDRHVGLFYKKRVNDGLINYSRIMIEEAGRCDNWGVFTAFIPNTNTPIPIHVEMETKTGKGKLNPDQENWRDFCFRMGWLWFEIRCEKQFVQDLKDKITSMGLVWNN